MSAGDKILIRSIATFFGVLVGIVAVTAGPIAMASESAGARGVFLFFAAASGFWFALREVTK